MVLDNQYSGSLTEDLDDEDLSESVEEESLDDDFTSDQNDDDFLNEDLGGGDFDSGNAAPMERHADLLKGLTNFDAYIENKVRGWLGMTWDHETSRYRTDPDITPIMNVKCALWLIDFLKTYARNNNIITNISQKEYKFLVLDIIDVLWLNIGTRSEEFGIKNNGDIIRICTEMQHSAELVLMGAGDGKYNEFLSTTVSRSESVNVADQGRQNNSQPIQQYSPPRRRGLLEKIRNKLVNG